MLNIFNIFGEQGVNTPPPPLPSAHKRQCLLKSRVFMTPYRLVVQPEKGFFFQHKPQVNIVFRLLSEKASSPSDMRDEKNRRKSPKVGLNQNVINSLKVCFLTPLPPPPSATIPFTFVYRTADVYLCAISKQRESAEKSAVRYTNLNGILPAYCGIDRQW